MDTQHFKQALLDKQRDLLDQIGLLGDEAQTDMDVVRDYSEKAAVDESTSDSLDEATSLTHTLEEVRDALQRIDAGTYGRCITCDEAIEPARLEAVPWAPYCRRDQEVLENKQGAPQGATL